jgi:hypothetical protein
MLKTILLVIVGLPIYLGIGYAWGAWCWKIYQAETFVPMWVEHAFWPCTASSEGWWNSPGFIGKWENCRHVARIYAIFWPLKIAWNMAAGLFIGLVLGTCFLTDLSASLRHHKN